jgi:hypothetical protein
MDGKERDSLCGIVVVRFLVDKVVVSASGQLFSPMVERFGLRGIHWRAIYCSAPSLEFAKVSRSRFDREESDFPESALYKVYLLREI